MTLPRTLTVLSEEDTAFEVVKLAFVTFIFRDIVEIVVPYGRTHFDDKATFEREIVGEED